MDTMRCYISNLHADEMFFQYQGDILNIDTIGGYPAERQHIQLDALPFHLQVFTDERGYYYELRYWENRFDAAQLRNFMIVMESLMDAMQEETLVAPRKPPSAGEAVSAAFHDRRGSTQPGGEGPAGERYRGQRNQQSICL